MIKQGYRITQNASSHFFRTEELLGGIWTPTGNEFATFSHAEESIRATVAFHEAKGSVWIPVTPATAWVHPELV